MTTTTENRNGHARGEENIRRLTVKLEPALKMKLKVLAVERECTMTEIVTDLLREALEDGSEKGRQLSA